MRFILKLILMGLAVYGISYLLSAIRVEDFGAAVLFVLVLILLNIFVRPILILLTIPVTIITLGLFLIVVNAIIIWIADGLMDSIMVKNFWWTIIFSILISIANALIDSLLSRSED